MKAKNTALATTQALARTRTQLLAEWHQSLDLQVRAGKLAETTRRTYEIGAEKFLSWSNGQTITGDLILEWIAEQRRQGRKPNTINTWLAGVRALCAWAVTKQHLPFNPAAGIRGAERKGTTRKHLRDTLTDREVVRVLAAPDTETDAGKRDRAFIALMAFTAARTVELHRAKLSDVKTESGRLVLQVQGKGRTENDEVLVIAHPTAEGALRDWLAVRGLEPGALFVSMSDRSRGRPWSLRAIRDRVKHYYKLAGVHGANKTTHSLRHAAITNAVKHGAPIQKVQSMARHANLETTMIYYHEVDRVTNPAEQFISYEEAE